MNSDQHVARLADFLNAASKSSVRDSELDLRLLDINRSEDLVALIAKVDVHLDSARALFRAAERVGGDAMAHARWLLAGALALEGLDEVARAVEPEQQATGLLKRSYLV